MSYMTGVDGQMKTGQNVTIKSDKTICRFFCLIRSMKTSSTVRIRKIVSGIRKIRIARNYSQDYMAGHLGISQNAYSKMELGYSKITLNRLFHVADILGVEATELLQPGAGKK